MRLMANRWSALSSTRLIAALGLCAAARPAVGPCLRADPAQAPKAFAACAACHDPGRANKTGPGLGGVDGRKAGTVPGFRYSRAMRRCGIVWDGKSLDAYLADPQGLIPGNTMPYPGVADAKTRHELVAY